MTPALWKNSLWGEEYYENAITTDDVFSHPDKPIPNSREFAEVILSDINTAHKRSLRKLCFHKRLSVILFTGGGGACVVKGGVSGQGVGVACMVRGACVAKKACMARGCAWWGGACVEEGECAWQGGMWHVWQGRTCMQERRPLKLAVCILLECILVEKCRKISKN